VSFGAVYKILQRTYKFGSQPLLTPIITDHYGGWFDQTFGKNSKDMQNAVSGALVGMGEVVLLPLDVLKIKSQTNPDVLKGRGLIELFVKENVRLYRGTTWTMARNAPGSFALFGANSLVYTRLFGVKGARDAKGYQIFVGSMAGGIASIIVSSPLDVIKTRLQNKSFEDKRSGFRVVGELVKEEGFHAFFKGLTPKIGLIGPKLVFSFTVAQWLTKEIQIHLEKAENAAKQGGGAKSPLEKAESVVKSIPKEVKEIKDKAEKDIKDAKDKVEKELKGAKDKVEKEVKSAKDKVEKEIKDIKNKADGHK